MVQFHDNMQSHPTTMTIIPSGKWGWRYIKGLHCLLTTVMCIDGHNINNYWFKYPLYFLNKTLLSMVFVKWTRRPELNAPMTEISMKIDTVAKKKWQGGITHKEESSAVTDVLELRFKLGGRTIIDATTNLLVGVGTVPIISQHWLKPQRKWYSNNIPVKVTMVYTWPPSHEEVGII